METGSTHSSTQPPSGPLLKSANGQRTPCWGRRRLTAVQWLPFFLVLPHGSCGLPHYWGGLSQTLQAASGRDSRSSLLRGQPGGLHGCCRRFLHYNFYSTLGGGTFTDFTSHSLGTVVGATCSQAGPSQATFTYAGAFSSSTAFIPRGGRQLFFQSSLMTLTRMAAYHHPPMW